MLVRRPSARLVLLAFAVLAAACRRPPATPGGFELQPGAFHEVPIRPADDGTIVPVRGGTPPEVGPDAYSTTLVEGPAAVGPGGREVASALQKSWARRAGAELRPDERLAAVASRLAETAGADGRIDGVMLEYESHRLGIPFASAQTITMRYSPGVSAKRLESGFDEALGPIPTNIPLARCGVAVHARGGQRVAVAVLGTAELSLAPVPRHAHRGEALWLQGEVAERFHVARVSVTRPSGAVRSWTAEERAFAAKVPLSEAGTWGVEILGDGASGPVVLANFPVWVDRDEPGPPTLAAQVQGLPATPGAAEARLLELVNQERARAGVPALAPLDTLAPVARAHSQDMADHGFFGHVSPSTGAPADRVKAAGLSLPLVGENLGRGRSADEVHRLLMESPAHRGAMLDPRYTHGGIGVVVLHEATASTVIATELFTAIQSPFEVRTAVAGVVDAINRKRRAAGAEPLFFDRELAFAAQLGADRFARDGSLTLEGALRATWDELGRIAARLAGRGLVRTQAYAAALALVTDAAETESMLDPAASGIGVGLAQRPASADAPPKVAVVLVLGYGGAR